jgi:hypothetical protein
MNNNTTIILLVVLLILSVLGINVLFFTGHVLEDVFEILQNVLNVFAYFFKKVFTDLGFITGTVINDSSDIISNTAKGGIDVANNVVHNVGNIIIKSSGKEGGNTEKPVNLHTVNTHQLLSDLSNVRLGELPDYTIPDLPPIVLKDLPNPAIPEAKNIKIPDLNDIKNQLTPFDFVIDSSVRINPPADCKQCIKTTTTGPISNATSNPVSSSVTSKSTPISSQPGTAAPANDNKSEWCFVGKDDNKRICSEMKSGDKCESSAVFPNKGECLRE